MDKQTNSLKQPSLIGLLVLFLLFVGGIISYKERLYFCDASYIPFNILRYHQLQIQEHRYGAIVTQIIPYWGDKLNLSITTILKVYTFSFNFFYLVVGTLLYGLRQYGLLLLMAFAYTLFVSDTYFWTNNEIHIAIGWMFLFFGTIFWIGRQQARGYLLYPVFTLLALITIYTHFIVLIPLTFLWVYFWVGKVNWYWSKRVSVTLTSILLLIVLSKFFVVSNASYDDQYLHNITHTSLNAFYALAGSLVLHKFGNTVLVNYWVALILLVVGIVALKKNGQGGLPGWVLLSITGYIILLGLTYTNDYGDIPLFHIESEWESMGIILATPFVFSYLPAVKTRNAIILLLVIFTIRGAYIGASYPKFAWRTAFKEKVLGYMKEQHINKLGLLVPEEIKEKLIIDWALPEETTLMSAMQHDVPQRSFCVIGPKDSALLRGLTGERYVRVSFGERITGRESRCFSCDTTHLYSIMAYEKLPKLTGY